MKKANATQERETRQLKRLGTLVDAVSAIVLVVMVLALPYPDEVQWTGASIWGFLGAHKQGLVLALIGTILVVLYWVQSNALFGNLARTDNRQTLLALVQVFPCGSISTRSVWGSISRMTLMRWRCRAPWLVWWDWRPWGAGAMPAIIVVSCPIASVTTKPGIFSWPSWPNL